MRGSSSARRHAGRAVLGWALAVLVSILAVHVIGSPALATGDDASGVGHTLIASGHGSAGHDTTAPGNTGPGDEDCGHKSPHGHGDQLCLSFPRQAHGLDGPDPALALTAWLNDAGQGVTGAVRSLSERHRWPSLYGTRLLTRVCVLRV